MDYEIVTLEEKIIAGVSDRTGNDCPDMRSKIGAIWQKFYGETFCTINNRLNSKAFGLYCDYAVDGSYTVLAGCQVSPSQEIASGLAVKVIPAGKYAKFTVKGEIAVAVGETWCQIWNTPLERLYTADFEEYQEDCDGKSGTVFIYVAIK